MKNKSNKLHHYDVDTRKGNKNTWFYLIANDKNQVEDYLTKMGIVFYNIFGPIENPKSENQYIDITKNITN